MADTKAVRPSRLKEIWRAAFGARPGTGNLGPQTIVVSGRSVAGKTVDGQSALQLSTAWACARLLAGTVATLPLTLNRRNAAGDVVPATDDPLYSLLHDAPHYDWTAVEFWEGQTLSLILWGNAFALKHRIGERLVALEPLRSDLMTVTRNRSGEREYVYAGPSGRVVHREDDVFHIKGFGPGGDIGMSVIGMARNSLGAAMAADDFAGAIFANGARPTGVLTVDQVLDAGQREQIRTNIVEPLLGADNAGGLMVLEAGLKFQPLTMTPEDSQFLETRGFHVEEICRWFGVPPFMVGHTENSSSWGTGIEQMMIGFINFTMRTYLVRIEQAISRSLIPATERAVLKPEFVVEGLLRGDSAARAAYYAVMVQNGLMTRNEARRKENLKAMPGADVLTVQSQNVPLGQNADPPLAGGE